MNRKLLSSLLSMSLLFQVLWMPAAFARPVEGPVLNEAENEIKAALVDSRSKAIWDRIESVTYTVNGNEDEDNRMERVQVENPEYDESLVEEYENKEHWSLRNYIFRYYTNLDKRKRRPLWGVSDSKLRYLPFDTPALKKIVDEVKVVAKEVSDYMHTTAPEEDRITIAVWYMLNVYGKMLGQLSLFSQERTSYDPIRLIQSQIRLKLPYSFATKYKENFKILHILVKSSSYIPYTGDTYLEYSPKMLLDLYTMAAAQIPTAHFYLNASRYRTMKNILKRIDFYKLTLDEYSDTPIPNSCRNIISGSFPATAPVDEVEEEEREYKMNAMLSESGLILYNTTPESNIRYSTYAEYYKDYASATIMGYDAGFNGLLPYEDYFASQAALNPEGDLFVRYYNSPQINDVEHFESILQGKGAQIEQYIAKKSEIRNKDMTYLQELANSTDQHIAGSSSQVIAMDTIKMYEELIKASYQIEEIWQQMVTFALPEEVRGQKTADGKTTIAVDGLNYYLAKKMVDQKVNILEDIVPEKIKNDMKRRWVRIRMPHMNSHDTWRKWALQRMVELIDEYVDKPVPNDITERVLNAFTTGCSNYSSQSNLPLPEVCQTDRVGIVRDMNMEWTRQIMRNFRNKIMPDESETDIFPRLTYDMNQLSEFYPVLQRVWDVLQEQGLLPDASVSEWEYLVSQLPYNGWAVLRLTHLLKQEEIKNDPEILPDTKAYYRKIIGMMALNRTFEPFHADRMLSSDEKKFFWRDIENQVDEKNFFIYKAKNSESERPYYEIMRHINDLNVFSEENRNYVLNIIGNNTDREELEDRLDTVMSSNLKKEVDHLNEMYNSMDDLDKLQEMADYYFDNFPHTQEENDFMDANPYAYIEVKDRFLMHEASIKTPIYHQALKEAAHVSLQDTDERLDKLCQYEYLSGGKKNKYDVSREGYNDLFAITSKAHVEFNQEFQLGIPKMAQKYADRMSKAELGAMLWAFGSAILYIISIPLSGGATLGMSPLVAASVTAKITIAAAALEILSGGIYEMAVILDAQKRSAERMPFQQFGTMTPETDAEIGYSYIWVMLEICFFSQLLGQVLKGVKLFTRTAYAAKRGVFKGLTHAEALAKYRSIARRVMTSNARAVLNMNKRVFRVAGDNWFKRGFKALQFEYLRGFKSAVSPIEANAQLAKVMARYFDDTTDQLKSFLQNYPQDRHVKLQRKLDSLQNASFAFRKQSRIAKLTQEISKFEDGSAIAKRLIDELAALPGTASLEEFILRNVDEISKITMQLSWRAWQHSAKAGEVFYHVLITGMPAGNKRLPILRNLVSHTPWLGTINDRILLQRLVSARQILIQDHNIRLAARQLGIAVGDPTKKQLTDVFYEMVERFTKSEAAEKNPDVLEMILRKKDMLEDSIAQNIINHYKSWGITHPLSKLDPITRKSANQLVVLLREGDAKAIAALNNTPMHKLFGMEIDSDSAFDVMKELSERVYRSFKGKKDISVEEFEILVNALKLRMMAINPRKYSPELKHTI